MHTKQHTFCENTLDSIEWLWGVVGKEGNGVGFEHKREEMNKIKNGAVQTNNKDLHKLMSVINSICVCVCPR